MRMLGPVAIASTVLLFGSGVAMLAAGPAAGWIVSVHKASFVVWLAALAAHVLGHVLRVPGLVAADYRRGQARDPRSLARQASVALALAAGLVLAVATVPYAAPWHAVLG